MLLGAAALRVAARSVAGRALLGDARRGCVVIPPSFRAFRGAIPTPPRGSAPIRMLATASAAKVRAEKEGRGDGGKRGAERGGGRRRRKGEKEEERERKNGEKERGETDAASRTFLGGRLRKGRLRRTRRERERA